MGAVSRLSPGGAFGRPTSCWAERWACHSELCCLRQEQMPRSCPVRGHLRVCAVLAVSGEGRGALGSGQRVPAGGGGRRVSRGPLRPPHRLLSTSTTQGQGHHSLRGTFVTGGGSGGTRHWRPEGFVSCPGRQEPWGPHLDPGLLWAGGGPYRPCGRGRGAHPEALSGP